MAIPSLLHRDTVAFVTPGLIHRLGNLLFTMQGVAQLDDRPIEHAMVRNTTTRGARVLLVARTLLGPSPEPPSPVGELMAVLADLVRLALRDAGHGFDLRPAESESVGAVLVDPSAFCPAVLAAIRVLGDAVPAGQSGQVTVTMRQQGRELQVGVGYAVAVGELPFPLAFDAIARDVAAALGQVPPGMRVTATPTGLELAFAARGTAATSAAAQA